MNNCSFCRDLLHPEKENMDPSLAKSSYCSLISPAIVQEMLDSSKFKKVKQSILQDSIAETRVDTMDVQEVMDNSGISRTGYSNIFKLLKTQFKANKIGPNVLPMPSNMRKSRKLLNEEVCEFLGPSFHIAVDFVVSSRVVHFNSFNNIFFSLQNLQIQMVRFYNITPEEVENKLIFVIKLDECEMLKQKKVERVTITLMNRALKKGLSIINDDHIDKQEFPNFSVQSENHIWWVGLFEVSLSS